MSQECRLRTGSGVTRRGARLFSPGMITRRTPAAVTAAAWAPPSPRPPPAADDGTLAITSPAFGAFGADHHTGARADGATRSATASAGAALVVGPRSSTSSSTCGATWWNGASTG